MPFVMTTVNDEVDVLFETDDGDFTIIVGALPLTIGKKIDELQTKGLKMLRAITTGENIEAISLECVKYADEMNYLLIKYGLRGQKGLVDSSNVQIECLIEKEEGTGFKVLAEKAVDIFLSNKAVIGVISGPMLKPREIGPGKYKVELKKGNNLLKKEDEKQDIPLTKGLLDAFSGSTPSTKENETAS